jgi:hypothetical protein
MRKSFSLINKSGVQEIHSASGHKTGTFSALLQRSVALCLVTGLLILGTANAVAADRYAVATGSWSSTGTWSATSGGAPGASVPAAGDDVYIEGGWTVTLDISTALLNTLTIASGSNLTANDPYTVSVSYGGGTGTITVNGTYDNGSSGAITATNGITVNGTYIHSTGSTTLPTATWNTGSTCEIRGWTDTGELTESFGQTFYNFTWNCADQATDVSFAGRVSTVNGTFTLIQSGIVPSEGVSYAIHPFGNATYGYFIQSGGAYRISDNVEISRSLTVLHDFSISNGEFMQDRTASGTLSIGGNYSISGGRHRISWDDENSGSTATIDGDFSLSGDGIVVITAYCHLGGTLIIGGNASITGGTMHMSFDDQGGLGTMYLAGDLSHTGGNIDAEPGGRGAIIFNGTGTQTYTSGAIISGTISYAVSSGSTLQMGTGANPAIISGYSDGTFTLEEGAALGITSPDGIALTGATGNIQLTGVRTYSPGADYIYNGTSAQADGTGLPVTVNNLTADNQGGVVTLSAARTIAGTMSVTTGSVVNLGAFTHRTGDLMLGGVLQADGSYGHSTSPATYQNDVYFDAATGVVNNGFADGTWLGITADWNTASNWSGGVPGSATDISISPVVAYQPVIDGLSVAALCNNMTINTDASLTINAGQALTVSGNLSNSGSLVIQSSGVTSSGSLIVAGTGSGSGTVTYNRAMPAGTTWHYLSAPVDISAMPAGSFYAWDEVAGDWGASPSGTLLRGVGYTLQTTGNTVSFTGTPVLEDFDIDVTSPYRYNDYIVGDELNYDSRAFVTDTDNSHSGAVTRSLTNYGGGGCNLLGNPYTSALNVAAFIGANYSTTPSESQFDPNYVALYLYNGSTYSYVSNSTGWPNGEMLDEEYIQAGQGFFVLAMNDNSTFSFTRSMQGHDIAVPLLKSARTDDRWPGLQLKITSGEKERLTTVIFNESMTTGLDPGYDIGQMGSAADIDIYTALVQDNGVNFSRQALPESGSVNNAIPVGVDMLKGGQVIISADTEPFRNYKFWLEDRVTGVFTDLGTDSYTVTLPPATYGTGRFFIIVSAGRTLRPRVIQYGLPDIRIWSSQDGQVNIQGTVSEKAICEVYNARGQKVYESHLTDSGFNSFTMPNTTRGVYVVRVADGIMSTTRKIVIL